MTTERFAPPRSHVEPEPSTSDALRLHRLTAIAIAVLFGGALAGGYLVIRNSLLLGRRRDAWVAAVLFGALFAAGLFVQLRGTPRDFLSQQLDVGIPRLVISMIFAWGLQHRFLRAHKLAGGRFRSRWFALALGIGTLAAWYVLWIVGAILVRSGVFG